MDCRRPWVLALGLAAGGFGCVHWPGLPLKRPAEPVTVKAGKESELPKRQPLAATCLAYGNFSVQSAADPKRSPPERERLHDQARKAYQQALKIEPTNLQALTALARLYTVMGDQGHAVATYQQAIQTHPKDPSLRYELGMCHARRRQWEPALASLREAVALDPESRSYAHALGFCLARAGCYDESFRTFARLEGEANAHYELARMLHHMNQDALSKQHLGLALSANPELGPARQLLAALEGRSPASDKIVPVGGTETAGKEVAPCGESSLDEPAPLPEAIRSK